MYITFCRFSGPYELDDRIPTKASTALDPGDALTNSTGLAGAASDNEIIGIAMQTKASSVVAQTPILVMFMFGRTKTYGEAEAGTFVTATDVPNAVDLNSADGLAADTTTNKDWLPFIVLSSTSAVGKFTHLATTFR